MDREFERRVRELAELPLNQYDRQRKKAASELRVLVKTLDREVAWHRKQSARPDEFAFEDLVPWPKAVDGPLLLNRLSNAFRRYVVLSKHEADTAALWILLTYCFEAFSTLPLLAIESATLRCGKTTLLSVAYALAHRAVSASNVSSAGLFRFIDSCQPTLLLDEADAWAKNNEDIRSVLNSGHTRAGACVIRCDGEGADLKPRKFSTWCPKLIALIGRLPATVQDRSIAIVLQRKLPSERVERYRQDRPPPEFHAIRRQCLRWAKDHFAALQEFDPWLPDKLNDRACDNWRPLLAIADIADPASEMNAEPERWNLRARQAARELSGVERDVQSAVELLLADIAAAFGERRTDRMRSQDLVDSLLALSDRPWSAWSHGRPMTSNQLARQLEPLGIKPKKIRFGETTGQGYELTQFAGALARYPPSQTGTLEQTKLFNGLGANQTGTRVPNVPVVNAGNHLIDKECSGVPVCEGGPGARANLVDCAKCLNFKRISDETGECTEHHGDAAPGIPRACRDYLPASSAKPGDGQEDAPGSLDAGDRGTKVTH